MLTALNRKDDAGAAEKKALALANPLQVHLYARQLQGQKRADEAYAIGAATASESYLNIDKILDVARRSGAQAIHPGYGFLSENARFAQACVEAGIKFIGPTATSMEMMGSKTRARQHMEKANIPFVPGTSRGLESPEEAAQLAQNLNGGSWTTQVLDSGKVDEQRFLTAIGNFFRVPVVALDAKSIDRQTLSILPSRFVFQHHILPIEEKENSVVLATYDLFNSAGRQLVTQLLKKPAEWVLVPRAQLLRAMKTLYGVGAETFEEILGSTWSPEIISPPASSSA